MRAGWRLGEWRGVSIALHWTVLLGLPWLLYLTRSVTAMLVAFPAFLFLLMAHELGHAAVAIWRRVEVKRIELFFLHGVCAHEAPDYEDDDVLIAWGGVAAQLVVLLIAVGVDFVLLTLSPAAYGVAAPVFSVLIGTNLFIMIFNLIPIAPFDGAKAWRAVPLLRDWARATSWGARVGRIFSPRQRARQRRLEAQSQRIAADIIAKLKKGKSDA
jgi:Zn-dependent protease